jgi:hypothetical protein
MADLLPTIWSIYQGEISGDCLITLSIAIHSGLLPVTAQTKTKIVPTREPAVSTLTTKLKTWERENHEDPHRKNISR